MGLLYPGMKTHDMSIIILVLFKTLDRLLLLLSLMVFPKIYNICKQGSFISDLLREALKKRQK